MNYKGYQAQISYSEEDEIFIGRIMNIENDIIAFDGYSVEELQQALKTVVDDYIDDCIKAGKQPEAPQQEIAA